MQLFGSDIATIRLIRTPSPLPKQLRNPSHFSHPSQLRNALHRGQPVQIKATPKSSLPITLENLLNLRHSRHQLTDSSVTDGRIVRTCALVRRRISLSSTALIPPWTAITTASRARGSGASRAIGLASRQWKPIQCQVLKVSIDEQTSPDVPESVSYSAKITYSCKISSVVYHSTCLTYQPTSGLTYEQAVSLIAGVLPGTDVTAYYNPRDKSQAVLIRTNDTRNAMPVVLSGLAAVLLLMWILTTAPDV